MGSTAPPGTERILVVDDEEFTRELLASALRFAGYDVETAGDGHDALRRSAWRRPDLVLLDVMMPALDGLEVCRRLRRQHDACPVIFLTARDASEDKVEAFAAGADDYVTKPFSLDELVARVRAVLSRSRPPERDRHVLEYGGLRLDDRLHRVSGEGARIELSPREFRLLRYLMVNAERVLSRAQILSHVWGFDFPQESGVVETYVFYLRRRLGPRFAPLVQTVRGVGYVLRDEPHG